MHTKRLIFIFLVLCNLYPILGQEQSNEATADTYSYQLYTEGKWHELLVFGETTIEKGIDFPLLRMRTGYAAFMLGNYSKSLKHYEKVYTEEPTNQTVLYYCYLNNIYLNRNSAERFYAAKLDDETKATAQITPTKISQIEIEYSLKNPITYQRDLAHYGRLNFGVQLGYQFELIVGGSFFKQQIDEPLLWDGNGNANQIKINQNGYFGKMVYTPSSKINLTGGFHRILTKFNSDTYHNTITFGGLNYHLPYIELKGMAYFAQITNSKYHQFDLSLTTYPMGNTNFYTISKGMFGEQSVFTQVAGFKVWNKTWLEGNLTLGTYETLIDHDGLYLINDIDTKNFKAGGSIYTLINSKLLASLSYNFEQKTSFQNLNNQFYQHSTTINLTWKL